MSKTEFIIWGVPADKKDEQVLYTKATSEKQAKQIMAVLERDFGASKMRIQKLEMNAQGAADLAKQFGKTVK